MQFNKRRNEVNVPISESPSSLALSRAKIGNRTYFPKIENKHMAGKYGDGVGVSGRDAITTPEGC